MTTCSISRCSRKLFSPAKLCNLILYQIPTTAHGTALTSIRGPIRSKNAPFSQKVESLIRFAARLPDRMLTSSWFLRPGEIVGGNIEFMKLIGLSEKVDTSGRKQTQVENPAEVKVTSAWTR